jgi:hypothetical protein
MQTGGADSVVNMSEIQLNTVTGNPVTRVMHVSKRNRPGIQLWTF